MLAGVKSQVASSMSGWLSGGIPGLNRGGGSSSIDPDPNAPIATDATTEQQRTRDPSSNDNVKDDDASRWVAGYVTMLASRTLPPILIN